MELPRNHKDSPQIYLQSIHPKVFTSTTSHFFIKYEIIIIN